MKVSLLLVEGFLVASKSMVLIYGINKILQPAKNPTIKLLRKTN